MARDLTVLGEVQSGVMGPVRLVTSGVDEFTSLFVDDFGSASSSTLIGKAVTWDDTNNWLKLTDSGEIPIGLISKVWPVTVGPTAIKRVQVQSSGIFTKSSWGLLSVGSNYYISGAGNGALAAATTYPESNEALVGYCIDSENLLLNFSGFNGETVAKQQKIRELLELVNSVHSGSNDGTLTLTGTLGLFPLTVATLVYPTLEVSKLQSTALHDGDGPSILFTLGTPTQVPAQTMASIEVVRDGANNEGTLILKAGTNGAEEFLRLDAPTNEVSVAKRLSINSGFLCEVYRKGAAIPITYNTSPKIVVTAGTVGTAITLPMPANSQGAQPTFSVLNHSLVTHFIYAPGSSLIMQSIATLATFTLLAGKSVSLVSAYTGTNQLTWYVEHIAANV